MKSDPLIRARADVARLRDEEVSRLLRSAQVPDERGFIEATSIDDKEHGGLVPFRLWESQAALLPLLCCPRLYVLKARQLGLTWLSLVHWLYMTTFWSNRLILVARQSREDALDALRRIKLLRASLGAEHPDWQQRIAKDRQSELVFANGSRFRVLSATKRMGRGEAAYGATLDEFAFWNWPAEQFAALEAGCANLHLITTGAGPGDYAEALWRAADIAGSPWRKVFLPWSADPSRTPQWYARTVEAAAEPRLARREYAASPEEAFAAPEGVFFERFSSEVNVVEMKPTHNWQTWRAVDFGYHYPVCLWIQEAPSGQVCVVAELAGRKRFDWTTEEFADAILAKDATLGLVEQPRVSFCDPAGNNTSAQTGESEVLVFKVKGLAPVSERSSIRDGCVRISDALAEPQIPLLVARDCRWLVEALGAVAADRQHPDVYDERSVYCHVLDALRYYFVNRPRVRQEFHPVNYDDFRSPFPWPAPGDGNAMLPYDQPRPLQQRSGPIW
jgi:hypothetical protein